MFETDLQRDPFQIVQVHAKAGEARVNGKNYVQVQPRLHDERTELRNSKTHVSSISFYYNVLIYVRIERTNPHSIVLSFRSCETPR